jgi:hypothetical protein
LDPFTKKCFFSVSFLFHDHPKRTPTPKNRTCSCSLRPAPENEFLCTSNGISISGNNPYFSGKSMDFQGQTVWSSNVTDGRHDKISCGPSRGPHAPTSLICSWSPPYLSSPLRPCSVTPSPAGITPRPTGVSRSGVRYRPTKISVFGLSRDGLCPAQNPSHPPKFDRDPKIVGLLVGTNPSREGDETRGGSGGGGAALVGGGLAAWLYNISHQQRRNRLSSRKTSSDDPYDGCDPSRRRLLPAIVDPPKSHKRWWRHQCGILPCPFQQSPSRR